MELTDGSFTEIKDGEMAVQRGTAHGWHNKSIAFFGLSKMLTLRLWIGFLTVLVPAKPVRTTSGDKPKGLHLP